ncbi:MAG: hypothetical protein R2882_09650 [Gemmatimonadales bacterium]
MAVELGGLESEIIVGNHRPIKVSTIEGDIRIRGGTDVASPPPTAGSTSSTLAGRSNSARHPDDIRVEETFRATSSSKTVSGEAITLRQIVAASVPDCQTMSGDVTFGTIARQRLAAVTQW